MKLRKWWIIVVLLILIPLTLFLVEKQTRVFQKLINEIVYDNYNHYLPCSEWPSEQEVLEKLIVQEEAVDKIKQINPNNIVIEIDNKTCPGKADLIIRFTSHTDRIKIEELLSEDKKFWGIPVRLINW